MGKTKQPWKSQCMLKFIPDIENITIQLLAQVEKLLDQTSGLPIIIKLPSAIGAGNNIFVI